MTETNTDEWLSPVQVAEWLGIPLSTLYSWRHTGTAPPAYRLGKHLRFKRAEVVAWVESRGDAGSAHEPKPGRMTRVRRDEGAPKKGAFTDITASTVATTRGGRVDGT
jgi:excisionase family DNA binding protein